MKTGINKENTALFQLRRVRKVRETSVEAKVGILKAMSNLFFYMDAKHGRGNDKGPTNLRTGAFRKLLTILWPTLPQIKKCAGMHKCNQWQSKTNC